MEYYKIAPKHWKIGGFSVSRQKRGFAIFLGIGINVIVSSLERAQEVIECITSE